MRISESKLNAIIRESLNDVLYEIHALKAEMNIQRRTNDVRGKMIKPNIG